MARVIPLFPLSHVLLPGMPLPLHIFEQRYRDLLSDIGAVPAVSSVAGAPSGAVFGVVALTAGTEAMTPHVRHGDSPDVEPIGTVAEVLEIETAADGTSDLLSVGSRRFRLLELMPTGKPYLRAEVEYLDEPDGPLTPRLETRARDLIDVFDSLLVRLAGRPTGSDLPRDANQLSYQLAARLPLAPAERQQLLADESTAVRLARITRLLRREIALLQGTRSIAVSPAVLRMGAGTN